MTYYMQMAAFLIVAFAFALFLREVGFYHEWRCFWEQCK